MAIRSVVVLSVLVVLVKGTHILEPESAVEAHSAGGVSSQGAISFPETRPAPGSQSQSPAPRPAPRPVGAPRSVGALRPAVAPRRPAGSKARPSVVVNSGRPIGGGTGHGQNRNRIQKPY